MPGERTTKKAEGAGGGDGATAEGVLVLVVGPSGAGKDALLDGARRKLAADPRFVFPRRAITRARDRDIEDHEEVTHVEFERRRRTGRLALSWRAHGERYGLPASLRGDLKAGRAVVANASRGIVGKAKRRFPRVEVIRVDAPLEVCAERLALRGRESEREIRARLARCAPELPAEARVTVVDNSGTLEAGIDRFVRALRKGFDQA